MQVPLMGENMSVTEYLDEVAIYKLCHLISEEDYIDPNLKVHLITWSPDPEEGPDASFYIQNLYYVNFLAGYLQNCRCGVFCAENTKIGNVHYHGWYQVDRSKEMRRVVIAKVMDKTGQLRITDAGVYKINNFSDKGNALWYYKKDVFDIHQDTYENVITAESVDNTNWNFTNFFTKKFARNITQLISTRMATIDFYEGNFEKQMLPKNIDKL